MYVANYEIVHNAMHPLIFYSSFKILNGVGSGSQAMNVSICRWNEIVLVKGVNPTGNEIGGGTYGKVFEVNYEGTLCAAKEIHKHIAQLVNKEKVLNQCHIWSTICHPNIAQLLGLLKYIAIYTYIYIYIY